MKIKLTTVVASLSIAMFSSSLVIVKNANANDWQTCTIYSTHGGKSELNCMTKAEQASAKKSGNKLSCAGSITYSDLGTCNTFASMGAGIQGKTYVKRAN